MKKLLVALPFVAGASWAGTTLYAGNQSQTAYDELIAQMQDMKPFVVENESYEAGFLNSVAYTRVKDSSAADATVLFRLRHDIDHSSVAIGDNGARVGSSVVTTTLVTKDFADEIKDEYIAGFTDGTPFVLTTQIELSGSTSNDLRLNPYSRTLSSDENGDAKITFDGGNYQISRLGDDITLTGSLGQLAISAKDEYGMPTVDATFGQSSTNGTFKSVGSGLYTGGYSHEISSLNIIGNGETVDMQGVKLSFDSSVTDGLMTSSGSFGVANLEAPIPLDSAELSVSIAGLPLDELKAFIDEADKLSVSEQFDPTDPVVGQQILESAKSVLVPGVRVEYALNATNDGGDIDAAFDLEFVGDGSANGIANVITVGDAVRTLKSSLKINGDADAVNMTPLAGLIMMSPEAQQFVVADDTSYRVDVTLEDLDVQINGAPFPVQMMMGDMLDMPISMLMSM